MASRGGFFLRLLTGDVVDWPANSDSAFDSHLDGDSVIRSRDDAGEFLDSQAKAEYGRRILELKSEVDKAKQRGDTEAGERSERELESLIGELRRAIGLGGRDRMANSNAERARLSVTRAIRVALGKIMEADPSTGVLLSRGIRTGNFCSYNPLA
jgi:hypothetical protein